MRSVRCAWVEALIDEIEREQDTHDYSSSDYSAYDDGYNEGVYDALRRLREKVGCS